MGIAQNISNFRSSKFLGEKQLYVGMVVIYKRRRKTSSIMLDFLLLLVLQDNFLDKNYFLWPHMKFKLQFMA